MIKGIIIVNKCVRRGRRARALALTSHPPTADAATGSRA